MYVIRNVLGGVLMIRIVVCAIWMLGLSIPAHADFSRVSSPVFGVNSLTFDSVQRLYWLAPSATNGLSFLEVQQLLANEPKFAGFRFASVSELSRLYSEFGIPDINDYGTVINGTTANVPGAKALQSYLGISYFIQVSGVSLFETGGFVGSPYVSSVNGFSSVYIGEIVVRENVRTSSGPLSFGYAATNLSSATIGGRYEGLGSWLVTSVPEPDSVALLAFGLLISVVVVSHKKAKPGIEKSTNSGLGPSSVGSHADRQPS